MDNNQNASSTSRSDWMITFIAAAGVFGGVGIGGLHWLAENKALGVVTIFLGLDSVP